MSRTTTHRPTREQQVAALVATVQDQAETSHKLATALAVFAERARPAWDLAASRSDVTAYACVEFCTRAMREVLGDMPDRETLEDCAARLHDSAAQFRTVGDNVRAGTAFGAGIIVTDYVLRYFGAR